MADIDRVTVSGTVQKATLERLRWLAARDSVTLGEAIDRAVANSTYLASIVSEGGNVITEATPGKYRKVTLK